MKRFLKNFRSILRRFAADAIMEAADAGIELIICITENIPVDDMVKAYHYVQARSTRLMEIRGPESYVYAPENGVYESFHELEAAVEAGQDAGCVHFLDDPGRKPEVVRFQRSGELFCRRAPGRVIRGNCVGIVINDYERGQ